eukprot:5002975-Pyramimonas_sp.AAC.1
MARAQATLQKTAAVTSAGSSRDPVTPAQASATAGASEGAPPREGGAVVIDLGDEPPTAADPRPQPEGRSAQVRDDRPCTRNWATK